MTSVVPRLTSSHPDGTPSDALLLVPSPRRKSHRPSDLKASPSTDFETPEPFEDNDNNFYSLKIPSPTYKIMFTPSFLITSCDSEDDYSDRLSNYSADDFIFTENRLPPWSSAAENAKPVVNRLIDEERRQHDSVRLAWRPTLPATPTASTQSLSASLGLDPSGSDALETQSSSWVPCLGRRENSTVDSDEMAPLLRRTQSLPNIMSNSSPPRKKFFGLNTVWSSTSIYSPKDKEDEIKRWASDISFIP